MYTVVFEVHSLQGTDALRREVHSGQSTKQSIVLMSVNESWDKMKPACRQLISAELPAAAAAVFLHTFSNAAAKLTNNILL